MGRQINFYLTKADIEEVHKYIRDKGIFILGTPMKTNALKKIDSLLDVNFSFLKFLSIP